MHATGLGNEAETGLGETTQQILPNQELQSNSQRESSSPSQPTQAIGNAVVHQTAPVNVQILPTQPQYVLRAPACVACRRRKVRCDKQMPCLNCKRALVPCIFTTGRAARHHRQTDRDAFADTIS
ncbi:hypothetical protein B0T10DRAFT_158326 [Thelonectria olida]|uniref:Zn(2)-C6 fungal-type domain-containing protein n=1 Tax=Thelonectria olida TaxID=1576542 RepID=A0A9P9AH32_9HYPO|nr:hypothetical protein B0T10DRAFT_158326 [Thelonectria olida]